MARNLENILDALPTERRAVIEHRAAELATLKDLRQKICAMGRCTNTIIPACVEFPSHSSSSCL